MTSQAPPFSDRLGDFEARVASLVEACVRAWDKAPAEPPSSSERSGGREKRSVEKDLGRLIDTLSEERKKLSIPGVDQTAALDATIARVKPFFRKILARLDLKVESVYDARFVDATRAFLRRARDFDPGLAVGSVYQALRNVWIMNTLQYYLGLEVAASDAVFGYSMVYPYLDNFLDDAAAGPARLETAGKLRAWLEGEALPGSNPREEKLRSLIGFVEREFPRDRYPGVFQSMLAIYNAQIKSLGQQKATASLDEAEILRVSLEKGGTSVLADGYLVAGDLTPEQREFCFGFGTFLQLADDLQDITEDLRSGHMTVFSKEAGGLPLDRLACKLFGYTAAVVETTLRPDHPRERALREMIPRNCRLMSMESIGAQPTFFSRRFVKAAQEAFPVRFSYLAKLRRKLGDEISTSRKTIADLDPLTAAFMAVSSRALSLE
jgi:hypothetical protein